MIPLIIKESFIQHYITPASNLVTMVVLGVYEKLGADRLELMNIESNRLEFSLASLPEDHREVVTNLIDDSLSDDFYVYQTEFNLIVTMWR